MNPLLRYPSYTSSFDALHSYIQRETRGDPGPSSRRAQESRLRLSIRSGRSNNLSNRSELDSLHDAPDFSPQPDPRRPFGAEQPRRTQPLGKVGSRNLPANTSSGAANQRTSGRAYPRQRFDPTSKNFYTPRPFPVGKAERLEPDPYDTSRQLREWIRAHPSPINHSSLQEAVHIVTSADKKAINAVVWNALLALIGREGSLERMWKLFNDVSRPYI